MTLSRRRWITCTLALAGVGYSAAGQAGDSNGGLTWVAGDLPPFAWSGPNGPRGLAHDLAVAMAQRLGRSPHINYVPWARAVRTAELGGRYGVFPLARTPDREAQFQWVIPLMLVRYGLYTLASEPPLTLADLRPRRVGVLRGSPIAANLRAQGFTTLIEAKDYRDLLRLLREGTLQVVYAGAPMLEAAMDTYGHARADFTQQATLGEATLYMAASRTVDSAELQRWRDAYQALEADGTVASIRRRYLR